MSSSTVYFPWFTDSVYAGGGKKLDRPRCNGHITVRDDGSIDLEPEDDYYGGTIAPETAIALALAILEKAGRFVVMEKK
jgi:hypothetical protein